MGLAAPAGAEDAAPSSTDRQLRTLSGTDPITPNDPAALHGLSRPGRDADPGTRVSATPLVRPDTADAAAISRALAAGNQTTHQLTTPEEDDAGSVGGSMLAIAGLVFIVVVIAKITGSKHG